MDKFEQVFVHMEADRNSAVRDSRKNRENGGTVNGVWERISVLVFRSYSIIHTLLFWSSCSIVLKVSFEINYV